MPVLADTHGLVADQIITRDQAHEIERRARQLMVNAGINTVLCAGIIAATLGLIAFLADPLAVAVTGVLLLGGGLLILHRIADVYRMFGNAAALIGSGMLIGGGFVELMTNYRDIAGPVAMLASLPIVYFAGRSLLLGGLTARFVAGSILLMGVALHLAGLAAIAEQYEVTGPLRALFFLYAATAVGGAGWFSNVRTVTALAIIPFAQLLDTSTSYFHAAYVFYSPESTLSILQMSVLIVGCLVLMSRVSARTAPHLRLLAIMGFIVANLCALVGSLWGDVVGSHLWGPGWFVWGEHENYDDYWSKVEAFESTALTISADVYSVVWALALIGVILFAAHKSLRGMFNTGVTFLAIHAYTQAFESFYDEPLAYVIGGFLAIPLAWGMWRLNQRFAANA